MEPEVEVFPYASQSKCWNKSSKFTEDKSSWKFTLIKQVGLCKIKFCIYMYLQLVK